MFSMDYEIRSNPSFFNKNWQVEMMKNRSKAVQGEII
jgi:hypothetical protein